MAYKYNLYPEAEKKLVETGLAERIKKAEKTEDFPELYGCVFRDELPGMTKYMQKKGCYDMKSWFFNNEYKPKLEAFVNKKEEHKWVVKKDGKEEKEDSDYEDFMLFSGFIAATILNPNEFKNFKKFGFSSAFDFYGCIGAYAWRIAHQSCGWREGHTWESSVEGKRFVSEVTGSEHGDLRIFRTDTTPYETLDPLGNSVNYRPEISSDRQNVHGYHSTEPGLLVALIKYADQEKILCPLLTPSGMTEIIAELKEKGQAIGNFGDFGYDSFGPRWHFTSYHLFDMPRLGEKTGHSFVVGIDAENYYAINIDTNGGLAFQHQSSKDKNSYVTLRIPKAEFPHLVQGLFVQAMKGLGRTSAKQLIDIVNYRFSEQFEKDKAEELSRAKPK